MRTETFTAEIARLRTEWASSYGEARCKALWECYRGVSDEIFHDAVTDLLLNPPAYGAPGQKHLEAAVDKLRQGRAARGVGVPESPSDQVTLTPELRSFAKQCLDKVFGKVRPAPLKLSARDKAAGEKGDE